MDPHRFPLPAGAYFIKCYPGPDWDAGDQADPTGVGETRVPSTEDLREWCREGLLGNGWSGRVGKTNMDKHVAPSSDEWAPQWTSWFAQESNGWTLEGGPRV